MKNNNILHDFLFGNIDKNKQYYTKEMFAEKAGHFALMVMLKKNLITKEELEEYKEEYMKKRNQEIIDEFNEWINNLNK